MGLLFNSLFPINITFSRNERPEAETEDDCHPDPNHTAPWLHGAALRKLPRASSSNEPGSTERVYTQENPPHSHPCPFSFGCNARRINFHLCGTFSPNCCWTRLGARKENEVKEAETLGDLALQRWGVHRFHLSILQDWKGKFSCSSEIVCISAHLLQRLATFLEEKLAEREYHDWQAIPPPSESKWITVSNKCLDLRERND